MKKKFITTVLIVVLSVVMAITALTGCTFIKENKERKSLQILQTVSKYGWTLKTDERELTDYINSNAASLINNYQFTVEEAIRYLSDRKAETKLLTIEGLNYLKNGLAEDAKKKREEVLCEGTGTIADGVLTWGEYYAAVKNINDSIYSQIESNIDSQKAKERKTEVDKASSKDIDRVEVIEGLEKTYLVGDTLDTSLIRLRIYYKSGDTLDIPVTDAMITAAFDSSAAADEKTLTITFTANNKVKNDDDEYEYQAVDLTADWKYEVKKAPTTRKKDAEDKEDSIVGRYLSKAEIAAEYAKEDQGLSLDYMGTYMDEAGLPLILDLEQKIATSGKYEKAAFRELYSNYQNAYRDMTYFYNNAIENQVLAALQWELQQEAISEKSSDYWDEEVMKQFDYLTFSAAENYASMSKKAQKEAFITAIGSALTSLYFIPAVTDEAGVENLADYAWVSQILFSWSDAEKEKLGKNPTDKQYENMMRHMTVDEANPEYVPNHEHDERFCEKNEDGTWKCNKDVAFLNRGLKVFQDVQNADGTVTLSVYSRLCIDLYKATEEGTDPLKVFEDYLYRFNSDDGIFNNDLGYLITPEGENTSWVDGFAKLGRALVKNSKDGNGLPTEGYYRAKDKDGNDETKEYTVDGQKINAPQVAYCFSEYGVHLMMVKYTPFNEIVKNKEAYAYMGGYRFATDTALTDKNRETGAPSKTTFLKTLTDNAKSEIKTLAYSDFVEKFVTDENKESSDTVFEIDEKKLNALIKEYTK